MDGKYYACGIGVWSVSEHDALDPEPIFLKSPLFLPHVLIFETDVIEVLNLSFYCCSWSRAREGGTVICNNGLELNCVILLLVNRLC